MHEKAKSKGPEISWAYRLSKMLHILRRDEIEVTATPEQCLQHLEKMYANDPSIHRFEVEVINNYKVYDVVVRSVDRRPDRGEDFFILCRLEGKGDKTIVSLDVSMGKVIFKDLLTAVFLLLLIGPIFAFFSILILMSLPEFELGSLLPWFPSLICLMLALSLYPVQFQKRNEMLAHIVSYMFQIEEKRASRYPLDPEAKHQSTHPAADFESHADPDQAVSGRYH